MKFKSVVRVVWNELCLKKLFFGMNIIIVSLLFSVALLVVSLASDLPKEIYKEVRETDLCYFDIGNIEVEDIEYLLNLPMTIESYGINGYWENYAQGLTEKQRENIIEEAVFFEFEQYRKGYNSKTLRKLNHHIIKGEGWEEADNERVSVMPMWISEKVAQALGVSVSEKVTLKNESCQIEFFIKGIYETNRKYADTYIPVCLCGELLGESGMEEMCISARCDRDVNTLLRIIGELKEKYFIVNSFESSIRSMLYFSYFLYVVVGIMVYMSLQILNNLNELYYRNRMEFWKINKAIGMTEMDIVKINNLLVEIIIVISLLFGTILACYLSQHFVLYIEDLFELEGLQCRLSGSSVVGLYLACNLLFILGKCIKIRKKENKSVGKNL